MIFQTSQPTKPPVPWVWPINKVIMKFDLQSFIYMHHPKNLKPEHGSFMWREVFKMDYQPIG